MECLSVFAVLEEVRGEFEEDRRDLDIVIEDSKKKIKFHMGHIQRSLVQTKRI